MKLRLTLLALVAALASPLCAQKASYSLFGTGCNGLNMVHEGLPRVGRSHALVMESVKAPRHPVGVLNFGVSNTSYLNIKLPVDLTAVGAKGCSVYISTEATLAPYAPGPKGVRATVTIPNERSLIGLTYFNQFIFYSPLEPGLPFSFSNGGKAVIGS